MRIELLVMTSKRLLSFLVISISAASLALLGAGFVDTESLLNGDPLQPLVEQVEAEMEERSRLHNERNERTFRLAERSVEHFCGGQPVVVVEVYDDTALISYGGDRCIVAVGVHRRPEDPAASQAFWPQPGEVWAIEATVRGPAIVQEIDVPEVSLSAY
jgi:hypothetical protein